MSSATYASVRRRSHSSASTAAPTAPAPNPAMCQPATLVRPAMNSGATAQPRLPDTPCTENACPRRGWLTRWLISVKSAGWKCSCPRRQRRRSATTSDSSLPAEHHSRERQGRHAEEEHPLRADAIDRETRQRLSHAADEEERGRQQPHVRVAEREVLHQPREERRQHQVEEVRSAVREAHQTDDLAVPLCADWNAQYPQCTGESRKVSRYPYRFAP